MAALDLSRYSEAVFTHARTLAASLNAELIVINVLPKVGLDYFDRMKTLGYPISTEDYIKDIQAQTRKEIEQEYLSRVEGISFRLLMTVGTPFREIVKAAREEGIGMVVIGPKGRTDMEGLFFGTQAEKIFQLCPCPVLSIRGPEHCAIP